jgi:hypothetical protein
LETHDVNASLKEKLKCLVFIPVISRTYCDPKSFAWEHEFKAFVLNPDNYEYLDTKGWGLFKQDKYQEALEVLQKSWDLKPVYDHDIYLHLEAVKKAFANQKNN